MLVSAFIGKQRALRLEVTCNFRLYVKIGRTSVKPSWKHWISTSKATAIVFKHEYSITLAMDGLSQMSRLNAGSLPIAEKCVEFVHVLSYLDIHDSLTRVLTQPSLTDDKLIQWIVHFIVIINSHTQTWWHT